MVSHNNNHGSFEDDEDEDEEVEVLTIPGGAGPTTLRLHRSGSIDVSTSTAMAPHSHSPKMRSVKVSGSDRATDRVQRGDSSSSNMSPGTLPRDQEPISQQYQRDTKSSALRARERSFSGSVLSSRRSSRSSASSLDPTGSAEGTQEERKVIRPAELTMHSKPTIASALKKVHTRKKIASSSSRRKSTNTSSNSRQNSFATTASSPQVRHSRQSGTSSDVLVDVHVAGTLIGTIEVCEGDVAEVLASEFVEAHGLSPEHIPKLAMLVCQRLDELYEVQADKERIAALEQRAFTNRLVSGAPTSSTGRNTRKSSTNVKTLNGSITGSISGSVIGQVIGRVRIQLPNNNTGVMTVRHGDDIGVLARQFCTSNGLTMSQANEIEARVRRQMTIGSGGAGNMAAGIWCI
jgi:hypothetical protein